MNTQISFLRLATRSFWFWFGGIWLLVGVPFFFVGLILIRGEWAYQSEGTVIQGLVLSKDMQRATKDQSTTFRVTYRFTALPAQTSEGDSPVSRERWEGLTEQGPIAIRYLPGHPAANRLEGENGWGLALGFLGAGCVFAPIGGALFVKALRRVRREQYLWQHGMIAEGTVTTVTETRLQFNNRHLWVLHFRYQDHLGRPHEGQSGYLYAEEAERWQVGEPGIVRFDREHPEQSLWVGKR